MIETRIPPQNLEGEQALLGSLLQAQDSSLIAEISTRLAPGDFYKQSHGEIFGIMTQLANSGEPVDLITVSQALHTSAKAAAGVSAADLAAMTDYAFAPHALQHAEIIRDAAHRRALLKLLARMTDEVYRGAKTTLEIASELSAELLRLERSDAGSGARIDRVIVSTLKEIDLAQREGVAGALRWNFDHLDQNIGEIRPGKLVVIGGRPSMGKTAFACAVARRAAAAGHGCFFVSCEMEANEIVERYLSEATGIENRLLLMKGTLTDYHVSQIAVQSENLSKLPFWILDRERSWDRIVSNIRLHKIREPDLRLVVLDYLGLIDVGGLKRERYLQLGQISAEAKALAMDLGIIVVLVSQLNREPEYRAAQGSRKKQTGDGKQSKRPHGKPELADLRESGNLEQDADIVALLWRPYKYDTKEPRELCRIEIAKNRGGPVGRSPLRFDEKTVSFSDWSEPRQPRDITQSRTANEDDR